VEKIESINYKDVRTARAVRRREREDRSAPPDGGLHSAPAPASSAIKQARNIALLPFAGRAN